MCRERSNRNGRANGHRSAYQSNEFRANDHHTNGNGCDEERAKDLISETILKAFESFDRLLDAQAFLSYLFTIAVRLHRRERLRLLRWQPFHQEHLEILPSHGMAPDASADISALYDALALLPHKQREAIVLSEIVGMKLEEVAGIQGASLSAVKSRVSRGKKKLEVLLGVHKESVSRSSSGSASESGSKPTVEAAAQPFPGPSGVASSLGARPADTGTAHQYRFAFQAKHKL
jgi:RNA polymerase sigma-70 factor (ECF subfamily)